MCWKNRLSRSCITISSPEYKIWSLARRSAGNFRPGATWLPAVVQKKLGPLMYLVKQGEGKYFGQYGTPYPPTSTVLSATVSMEETAPANAALKICQWIQNNHQKSLSIETPSATDEH